MSEIKARDVSKNFKISELKPGQRIVFKILNADDSVAHLICDDSVPEGLVFSGSCNYIGRLE